MPFHWCSFAYCTLSKHIILVKKKILDFHCKHSLFSSSRWQVHRKGFRWIWFRQRRNLGHMAWPLVLPERNHHEDHPPQPHHSRWWTASWGEGVWRTWKLKHLCLWSFAAQNKQIFLTKNVWPLLSHYRLANAQDCIQQCGYNTSQQWTVTTKCDMWRQKSQQLQWELIWLIEPKVIYGSFSHADRRTQSFGYKQDVSSDWDSRGIHLRICCKWVLWFRFRYTLDQRVLWSTGGSTTVWVL